MAYKPFVKQTNNELVELPLCAEQLGTSTIGSTSEPVYLDAGIPKACSGLKSMILDLVYPVGSYFITESSNFNTTTKVANHFGGTWTRVEGRFLYGSSSAGGTGGSNNAVVVSHSHTFTGNNQTGYFSDAVGSWAHDSVGNFTVNGVFSAGSKTGEIGSSGSSIKKFGVNFSMTPTGTISTEGNSGTNANMPAYRTVYMYRRTA